MSPRTPRQFTPLPIPISTITRGLAFRPPRALGTVPPGEEETLRVRPLASVRWLFAIAVATFALFAVVGAIALR